MDWPPDVADDLPAPRGDEPSSLRQDIVDELADHLQCAFTRELHLTRDEQAAQDVALDRFGDPRAIARKLWFDALRDNIMSQRLTFVALAIVLVVSLASTAATWFVVDQGRRANEAMLAASREANESLIAQSRETNTALLKKLDELSTTGAAQPMSLEWNPVKVRLYSGDKPGTPAYGFTVTLTGHILDTSKLITLTRTTDATGIADFGLVRAGEHSFAVTAPWKESTGEMPLYVLPGKRILEEIQCPEADAEKTNVQLKVVWPDDLKSRGYWLVCQFVKQSRAFGKGPSTRAWSWPERRRDHFLLLDANSQITPFPFGSQSYRTPNSQLPHPWPFSQSVGGLIDIRGLQRDVSSTRFGRDRRRPRNGADPGGAEPSNGAADKYKFVFQGLPSAPQLRLAAAEYQLEAVLIGEAPVQCTVEEVWRLLRRGSSPTEPMISIDRFSEESRANLMATQILAGVLPRGDEMKAMPESIGFTVYRPLADWSPRLNESQAGAASTELRRRFEPRFVAEESALNIWKIELPEMLLERLRGNPDFEKAEADAKKADAPENDAATKSGDEA
jgi:hypothetical protein